MDTSGDCSIGKYLGARSIYPALKTFAGGNASLLMHPYTGCVQFIAEVAQGGEDYGDAQLMAPDMCGFPFYFSHLHGVLRGVEAIEHGGLRAELMG